MSQYKNEGKTGLRPNIKTARRAVAAESILLETEGKFVLFFFWRGGENRLFKIPSGIIYFHAMQSELNFISLLRGDTHKLFNINNYYLYTYRVKNKILNNTKSAQKVIFLSILTSCFLLNYQFIQSQHFKYFIIIRV